MSSQGNPPRAENQVRDKLWEKVLLALGSLVFVIAVLVLPPVTNAQLAQAEKIVQKPLVAVALALAAVSVWRLRFAIAILIILVVVTTVQVTYYVVTTNPGRAAVSRSAGWQQEPVAPSAQGSTRNKLGVFGYAQADWSGNTLRLDLHSETGTTQQGFNLNGENPTPVSTSPRASTRWTGATP